MASTDTNYPSIPDDDMTEEDLTIMKDAADQVAREWLFETFLPQLRNILGDVSTTPASLQILHHYAIMKCEPNAKTYEGFERIKEGLQEYSVYACQNCQLLGLCRS